MEVKLKRNKWVLILIILLGTGIAFLNETALTTALATIMRDLNLTAATGQWLTTIFMLVAGIMIPMTAFLIEKFSTRTLFFIAMGLFTVGTFIGAFAGNFEILLIARILQAMGGGITLPLIQVVVLSLFKPEERGGAMGIIGIIISFAPAIGPTLSGWIVTNFQWRYIFLLSLPVAIIDLILAIFLLENVKEGKKTKIDILSAITSAIGFGGLLYGFSNIGTYKFFNPEVYIPLLVGVIALIYFSIRQLRLETPFLNLKVFKNKTFTFGTLVIVIVFAAFIGAGVILPLYIQDARGYSALDSGLILMPGAILNGLMNPITGKLFDKFGARYLSLIGLACVTAATFEFTTLSSTTPILFIVGIYALMLLGIGMVLMPVTTMALNALNRDLYAHGTAAVNTLRQVMASIGTALFVAIMTYVAEHSKMNPIQGEIHGITTAFFVAGALSLLSLIIAFFVIKNKKKQVQEETIRNIEANIEKGINPANEAIALDETLEEEISFDYLRGQMKKEELKEEITKEFHDDLVQIGNEIVEKLREEIKSNSIHNQEKVHADQLELLNSNNNTTNDKLDKLNDSVETLIKEEKKTKNIFLIGCTAIIAVTTYLFYRKRK